MSLPRISTTRSVQIGFGLLLLVCAAQTIWWVLDEVAFSRHIRDRDLGFYQHDEEVARRLRDYGVPTAELQELFPHLEQLGAGGDPLVRAEVREALDDEMFRRRRRYGAEGAFFLVILAAGLIILSRALRQRVSLQRRQENFLAAVSHELKSPLASMSLGAQTLALRDPPVDTRREILERMLDDTQRLEAMVSRILEANRLGARNAGTFPEVVQLGPVVQSILEEFEPQVVGQDIEVQTEVAADAVVLADPTSVRTIVRNLLDNAIKSLEQAGDGRIQVRAAPESKSVTLTVSDNGIGFPKGMERTLFEKFYRLGNEMRRSTKGTGLGLYLVQRLAELDRGSVAASSGGPGQGATFRVTWPQPKAQPA